MGSFLFAGLFNLFECPNQILHSGFGVSVAANGHWDPFVSNSILFVPHLLRMGEMRRRRTAKVKSQRSMAMERSSFGFPAKGILVDTARRLSLLY